jgi:hypothetical protein
MRKLQNYLLHVLLILITTSKVLSQEIPKTDDFFEKLKGSWIWIKSTGKITDKIETPKTRGFDQTIEFSNDSIYRIFRNNILISERKFTNDFDEYTNGKIELFLVLEFKRLDTLYVSGLCLDCLGNIYVRKK